MAPPPDIDTRVEASRPTGESAAAGQPLPAAGERLDGWLERHLTAVVLVVLGLGLALRALVAALTFLGPDEALNLLAATRPPATWSYGGDWGPPQPLYWAFLGAWRVLGRADFILRLPSVLAGSAAGWFGFLWLRSVLGRAAGLFGALLLAFAPALVRQSALADGTALLVLFVTAALFLLERARARPSARMVAGFGALLALAVASGLPGLWFALAAGGYVALGMLRRPPARPAWALLASVAAALVLGVVLYWPVVFRAASSAAVPAGSGLFDFGRDGAWSFAVAQTIAVYNYIAASAEYGLVLLVLFIAAAGLLLFGRLPAGAGGTASRELGLLLLVPFVLSYAGAVAGVTAYGNNPSSLFLAVFVVAGLAALWARVAGRPLWLALAAGLVIAPAWNFGPAGATAVIRDQGRGLLSDAFAYVRETAPTGGLVFSDRPTRVLLERYLSAGRAAPWSPDAAEVSEVSAGGYRLVSPGRLRPLSLDSLDRDFARLNSTCGPARGTMVGVVAIGESGNLADNLERYAGVVYPGRRAFGPNVAVFFVPMTGDALSAVARRAADAVRTPPEAVFWPSGRLDDPAVALLGDLAGRVIPYSRLYRAGALRGGSVVYRFVPALAVWVFGSPERHPLSMRYMDDQENYYYADLKFTLLAADEDSLAGLYLIESPVRQALDSLARAGWWSPQPAVHTVLWPTDYPSDSVLRRPGRRPARIATYSDLYRRLDAGVGLDQFLPAYAFWAFGSEEEHPAFMRFMDDGEHYTSAGYQFSLLAADPETLAGVYLVESSIGMALDSLARVAAGLAVGRLRAVLWPGPHFTDSTAERAGRLAGEVVSYSELYRLTRGRPGIDDYLPALAFWTYDSPEEHPEFMAQMDKGESYVSGQYRFTLLLDDREAGAAVYLVESRSGPARDSALRR